MQACFRPALAGNFGCMGVNATALLAQQGNVLGQSLSIDTGQPAQSGPVAVDPLAFEMANASILAAALGMGIYIDTFM